MLYANYAKFIYRIIGLEWSNDPAKQAKISLRKLKVNICKAEGYERDMISLMYGTVGILDLDKKTEIKNGGRKIRLRDMSDTSHSFI